MLKSAVGLVLLVIALSSPVGADPSKINWVDTATGRVHRANATGSNVEDLVVATAPNGIALDLVAKRVYWLECCGTPNGRLKSAKLDGSDVQTLISSGFGFPQRVAVDPAGGKVYWTDSAFGEIRRSNLNGSGAEDLIGPMAAFIPIGVALDVPNGKMYFTEGVGALTEGIYRANLDGSGVEALLTAAGGDPIASTHGIALDLTAGKMYWTDLGFDTVRRADTDGSNVELLLDFVGAGLQSPIGIAVDPAGGKIYVSDTTTNKIYRADLDGSNLTTILTAANGLSFPRALALDFSASVVPALSHGGIVALVLALAAVAAVSLRMLQARRASSWT